MFEFHGDRKRYYEIQKLNTEKYVLPFIEQKMQIKPGFRVLEIGCGEAGVLAPFLERGCVVVGVELEVARLDMANQMLKDYINDGRAKFVGKDIYKVDVDAELGGKFDLIILKDVIEHIHDQKKLIAWMKSFLAFTGAIFFGFPPWQMPFGGHQQLCRNKWLSTLPYYHLLPRPIYKWLLKKYNEPVDALLEIRDTGISIERFERIVQETGYKIAEVTHYLLNPIYEYKFGWKARKQLPVISHLPYLRDYLTTCAYYLIKPL